MISDEKLQKALKYLAETDIPSAEAETDVARQDYIVKQTRASVYQLSEGSQELRKAKAETSEAVQSAVDNYLDALLNAKELHNKRKTAELITRIYQTESANRRQGGI